MSEIGEFRRTVEIRLKDGNTYIYHACEDCGKERWVALRKGIPVSHRCNSCAGKNRVHPQGEKSSGWKGGRYRTKRGYIKVWLHTDDFFYPMVDCRGYVYEHRLVVAKALGRCLHLWELIHHKNNCAKDDNRYPETLQLVTDDRHKQITILETRIVYLEKRIAILENEKARLNKEKENNKPALLNKC